MYFFYIDESGNRDAAAIGTRNGETFTKDHLYVLTALSLYEHRWKEFDLEIRREKHLLLDDIQKRHSTRLELADAEVHSNLIRRSDLVAAHPFFGRIDTHQRNRLIEVFYTQLSRQRMRLFAVVIDKRNLHNHFDSVKLQRKAYELLLERLQSFLQEFHGKHLGVLVTDDTGIQMNRSLAMKHSYFLSEGTTSGLQLRNVVEIPFFVRSELSNGIQLADLCAYNIYRVFKNGDVDYPYFRRILPYFYCSQKTHKNKLDGLKIFPDDSTLVELGNKIAKEYRQLTEAEEKN